MTKTHIFAVAVEKYLSPKVGSVAHAENDARMFVKAWQDLGVDPSDCVTLLSAQATQASIRSHFKKFLNIVQKEDTVIFFFAGHGIAFADASYITAHDTLPGDLKATSIALSEILGQLRSSPSERVLLFVDSCHSGLPISPGMRSVTSTFSDEEMKQFCEDSEYHVAFASCKVDEFSWSNPSLKHGIWSYCVIDALSGKAKGALEKGNLVTGDSLRDYLAEEVPRLLRKTRSGNETQTPCVFGNYTKQFVVANLKALLAQRTAQSSSLGTLLKDSSLRGEELGRIQSLSGFQKQKGHREPYGHNSATAKFVRRVGEDEVKNRGSTIFQQLRAEFGFKKADIDYAESDGAVTIKTPDFDVNIWVEQDPDDPASYRFVTDVGVFRNPSVVREDRFERVFSKFCDTIVIQFSKAFPVSERIEEIEALPQLADKIDFDESSSWFTLTLKTPPIRIYVWAQEMRMTLTSRGTLKQLLASSDAALAALSGSGVTLLLPSATSP